MGEAEYLAVLAGLHRARWPADLPSEPQYPFGEVALTEYLRRWAEIQPDKAAVIFHGFRLTYGELDRLSERFAALLLSRGICRGDRIAVFLPNCPQYFIAFYGIMKLGAVHVPINPMYKAVELRHALAETGARGILAQDQLFGILAEATTDLALDCVLTTAVGDMAPTSPEIPAPAVVTAVKEALPGGDDLMAALATAPATLPVGLAPGLDDLAALNFTGGTTGMPKGCMHTQRDMVYTAATTVPFSLGLGQDGVYLNVFPVFWMAGEDFGLIFPIFAGATCVLLARWDPVGFMAAIDRYGVTNASLLVDGAVEILEHPDRARYDLRSLERTGAISFVKKLNPDFRARWRDLTGATIRELAWGMTETQTCDTMNYGFDTDDFDLKSQPVFVGIPVPGTEFKICDFETGALKPLGQEGELCIRSCSLLKGYWNRPAESAVAFRDGGWFHTGDIGLFDTDGFLHFLGRRKEMLKVNGMSVFPGELEALMGQFSGIAGCAIVGRADETKGEVPVAFVMLAPRLRTAEGEAAFTAWCRDTIASYKLPEMRSVDALPMTETGKVIKDVLRRQLAVGSA